MCQVITFNDDELIRRVVTVQESTAPARHCTPVASRLRNAQTFRLAISQREKFGLASVESVGINCEGW